MYSNLKSVKITQAVVRACYVLLALVTAGMLFVAFGDMKMGNEIFKLIEEQNVKFVVFPFCAVVPAGYVALVGIDRLLSSVKADAIFEKSTLRNLDIISIACAYASLVGLTSIIISRVANNYRLIIVYFVLMLGELFMALILQVIKQVFKKAIELKCENDLTI